jgi:hypothetical protein
MGVYKYKVADKSLLKWARPLSFDNHWLGGYVARPPPPSLLGPLWREETASATPTGRAEVQAK